MPTVKDELGNVVAEMPYDDKGEVAAENMVQENPGYIIVNAPDMREQMYEGGGMTGLSKVGMYKKGGKV